MTRRSSSYSAQRPESRVVKLPLALRLQEDAISGATECLFSSTADFGDVNALPRPTNSFSNLEKHLFEDSAYGHRFCSNSVLAYVSKFLPFHPTSAYDCT